LDLAGFVAVVDVVEDIDVNGVGVGDEGVV